MQLEKGRGGLLDGPDVRAGAEGLRQHRLRLGPVPAATPDLIPVLEGSGLLGRGGASFPVGAKWRAVASRSAGPAVVIANGAEGEALSRKDQALMAYRPHLVLDGAFLAADAVGADRVFLYLGEAHQAATAAMTRALAERPDGEHRRASIVLAPGRYVAGEETAAVNFLNTGHAVPRATPPRPYERGVDGRPTLVQNVESLAHAALIARRGDHWFRSQGRGRGAGTLLVTVGGAVAAPGVREVPAGTTIAEAVGLCGGAPGPVRAFLVGGYFGTWMETSRAWLLPLEAETLKTQGAALGCGVIWALDANASPVDATAQILGHLAAESAAQCGPCFFGLRSLADACGRIAARRSDGYDLERLRRWTAQVRGRGACRHPDGAVAFLQSALSVFEHEFQALASGHIEGAAA